MTATRTRAILAAIGLAVLAGALFWRVTRDVPVNPLTASGQPRLVVMDFTRPFSLDPLPKGWRHRTFWTRPAMQLSQAKKDGITALRLATEAGGSILGRYMDVSVGDYPNLSWSWRVDKAISGDIDERTKKGDDHAIRLFLVFADSQNRRHPCEIIWANKHLRRGDYKYIGDFPHYVAHDAGAGLGKWVVDQADLMAIYRHISRRTDIPRLKFLGLFADSDDTKTSSIAWVSKVTLSRKP